MLGGAWSIVEMQGPDIFSFIFILILSGGVVFLYRRSVMLEDKLNKAKKEIDNAKSDVYKHFGKDITEIKTNMAKQAESSKAICVTLDNVQKDLRQMREINSRK